MRLAQTRVLQAEAQCKEPLERGGDNVGALIIRVGFWGFLVIIRV